MQALAESARVVLTTVGPYQLYGEPLLAACVAAGTDYADLCGEPVWMRQMVDKYHAAAEGERRADRLFIADSIRSRSIWAC